MRAYRTVILSGIAALAAATAAQASVEISSAATSNMRCSAGVCAPTAKKAVLNATDLANMLATSDVKVVTGSGAVTITVAASFSWTSASRLTLDAAQNVAFAAPVSVAGPGGLSIVYNDGGTDGDLAFSPGAKIDFWDLSSSLTINGNAYTLVGSIAALAADAAADPSFSFYALAIDYDASTDTSWPIPAFDGYFEGLGHQISNMTLSDASPGGERRAESSFGLFAVADGAIRDLDFEHVVFSQRAYKKESYGTVAGTFEGDIDHVSVDADFTIVGKGCSVGGLVGFIGVNSTFIRNSSAKGSISGCQGAGGLAGVSYAAISNSASSVAVSGQISGGLAAVNYGSVESSHTSGTINGGNAGGLVGQSLCGFIDQSYATGNVSGTIAGGLVGYNTAGISNSYAMNAVHARGASTGGGLVGSATDYSTCGDTSEIENSYSTAAMSGHGVLGGVIGKDNTAQHLNGDVYWDLDTSGIGNPSQGAGNIADDAGLTGLTDAQLKSGLPAGFDPSLWGRKNGINNGYPYLLANPPQ